LHCIVESPESVSRLSIWQERILLWGATNVITFNYLTTAAIGGTMNDYRVPLMYYSYDDT